MALRWLQGGGLVGDSLYSALQVRDSERLRRYREYLTIYEGRHWVRPRNGRSSYTLNYCKAVCDKGVSFLLGDGVGYAVPDELYRSASAAQAAERVLYEVHDVNDLDLVDQSVALNAIMLGDGVYKVWWDPAERTARVCSVDPLGFFPDWSAEQLGRYWRVMVAYQVAAAEAERVYGRGSANGAPVEVVERWTVDRFERLVGGDSTPVWSGPNPYGFIPFVHVPNLPGPNDHWGTSDIRDLIGLNRSLNERMSDQADTIRYHADPPVIFKGVSDHTDLAVGPGTVWDVPADAAVELLEWRGESPQVDNHLEALRRAIFEVGETPQTAFGDSGRLLSGVALETELRPIVQKTLRRRASWTAALKRRNAQVLRLVELFGGADGRVSFRPYRTRIVWPPMLPRDDAVDVQNQVSLVGSGIRSARSAMDALGTEDPEAELAKVVADRKALAAAEPEPEGAARNDDGGGA